METLTYQEIMIIYESRYFSRELLDNDDFTRERLLSHKEQLAEACWNGLLKEMLPEITSELVLQKINEGNKFLNVCMGDQEEPWHGLLSVNPYFFLNHVRKN